MRWLWLGILVLGACSKKHDSAADPPARADAGLASAADAGRPASDAERQQAHAHNVKGDTLASDERWPEAIAEYRQALALDGDFVMARLNLGWALVVTGDLPAARAENQRALDQAGIEPRFVGAAQYNLGRVAEAEGKLDEAKQRYRMSLTVRPNRAVAERLASLLTPTERDAEPTLNAMLAQSGDLDAGPSGILGVRGIPAALRRLGRSPRDVVTGLPPGDGLGAVVVVGAGADGGVDSRLLLVELADQVARMQLDPVAGAVDLARRDVTGDGKVDIRVRLDGAVRIYELSPRGMTEVLALPRPGDAGSYEISEVPFGDATDFVAVPHGAPGPSAGRWRYLNGSYRKLEL